MLSYLERFDVLFYLGCFGCSSHPNEHVISCLCCYADGDRLCSWQLMSPSGDLTSAMAPRDEFRSVRSTARRNRPQEIHAFGCHSQRLTDALIDALAINPDYRRRVSGLDADVAEKPRQFANLLQPLA